MADTNKEDRKKAKRKTIRQALAPYRKTYPELKAQFEDFIKLLNAEDARKNQINKEEEETAARHKEIEKMAKDYSGLSESERAMFDELRNEGNAA